jgi:uncharacterized protein YegP (UPF0339 family)
MGKFVLYKDLIGQPRWRLESDDGELLAVSGSFKSRAKALAAIEACRLAAAGAVTEETAT